MVFIHKDKKRGRIMGQKIARTPEEAVEILMKDVTNPIMEKYRCPICKTDWVGTRTFLTHFTTEHPKNAEGIFSINPNAYQEWVVYD